MLCFILTAAFYGTEVVLFHLFEICAIAGWLSRHLCRVLLLCIVQGEKKKSCEAWPSKENSNSPSASGVVCAATLYCLGKISATKCL